MNVKFVFGPGGLTTGGSCYWTFEATTCGGDSTRRQYSSAESTHASPKDRPAAHLLFHLPAGALGKFFSVCRFGFPHLKSGDIFL